MNRWHEPAPGEREAGERTWEILRHAHEERLPAPKRRDWRPLLAAAAGAALLAAAITAPGEALRDAVRGEENASPALFALPAPGRLLVNSAQGAWVVQQDGSKRLLAGYRDASWSPQGLFLAAVRGHELRALEPDGDIRWSIPRREVALPGWSSFGQRDERVAYLSGRSLRVVGGNGEGDRLIARRVTRIAPAWKPRTHALTFFDATGNLRTVDADTKRTLWRARLFAARPLALAWSDDGRRLVAATASELAVLDANGRTVSFTATGGPPRAAAFAPGSHRFALLRWLTHQRRNGVEVIAGDRRTQMFAGAGAFGGITWSPDGRWLLVDWDSADQWVFISPRKVTAISNVEQSFGPAAEPAGWCCP